MRVEADRAAQMMLFGFTGLGIMAYRRPRKRDSQATPSAFSSIHSTNRSQ